MPAPPSGPPSRLASLHRHVPVPHSDGPVCLHQQASCLATPQPSRGTFCTFCIFGLHKNRPLVLGNGVALHLVTRSPGGLLLSLTPCGQSITRPSLLSRACPWLSSVAPRLRGHPESPFCPLLSLSWPPGLLQPTLQSQLSKAPTFFASFENPQWHTMEYYSAIKRNEVLIHATTWMNLESIVLGERS